jgi:hypothetical protein
VAQNRHLRDTAYVFLWGEKQQSDLNCRKNHSKPPVFGEKPILFYALAQLRDVELLSKQKQNSCPQKRQDCGSTPS